MEKIKIENLTFKYPTRAEAALNCLNITINDGDFVTICGKSGCGKSTLLRQLKPALAAYGERQGAVYFDGRDVADMSLREQAENLGFVMQNPDNQIVCDKVWHELAFGLESLSYSNTEIRARVAEMAAFFGIQDWYYKDVCELSGGQKQLLNLASVMVMQPSVLILDEPTSQLDPIAAHDFLDTIAKINKELGTTVILSEHRLEEALPLSDRVIVMENGSVVADGDVRSVGKALKEAGSDMFVAMPTPMRVYYSLENGADCPITVRECRKWLDSIPVDKSMVFENAGAYSCGETVLRVDDAWFRYEKESPDVLKGLSLTVREGEFYAIVGGNGAGKTTALSAIMGIVPLYRGKIEIRAGKKIAALPQNPQSLFVKKTVLLDLQETAGGRADKTLKAERIKDVLRFCELEDLLESHPYDLSGGEQQRAALAKVLLCEPDILLLDEPTKGLDAHFKRKLAGLLRGLQKSGVTIIMVSHDIEFCAKYADRLGMFFDGSIVSEDTPREFFSGKSFYTTAANRSARHLLPKAVIDEDIIAAIGGKQYVQEEPANEYILPRHKTENANIKAEKSSKKLEIQVPKTERKLTKRTLMATSIILLLIPLTIYIGSFYLGDRKYYFTSLLIILETMLPFILIFEGRKPQARELVIISVLCAIAVAGRIAFVAVPEFKPVIAIVIISGLCFGGETGFLVGAITAFVSNFYFAQGPWTPWQMFAFGITGFLAGVLFKAGILRRTKIEICIFGFLVTLIVCGSILNIGTVLMTQNKINAAIIFASMASGFPMDFIHALSTVFFLWLALEPMCEKLERIKVKYGLM